MHACDFLRVLWFSSNNKTDSDDITEILLKVVLKIITLTINFIHNAYVDSDCDA